MLGIKEKIGKHDIFILHLVSDFHMHMPGYWGVTLVFRLVLSSTSHLCGYLFLQGSLIWFHVMCVVGVNIMPRPWLPYLRVSVVDRLVWFAGAGIFTLFRFVHMFIWSTPPERIFLTWWKGTTIMDSRPTLSWTMTTVPVLNYFCRRERLKSIINRFVNNYFHKTPSWKTVYVQCYFCWG